jgi:hypothetical protein
MNISLDCHKFNTPFPIRKAPLNKTIQPHDRRRGGRVFMSVPVEVRSAAQDGSILVETAQTCMVGPVGAMVRTSRSLRMGTEVVLTNRFSQQTARFRVVWVGEQRTDGLWEIGIESLVPLDDFWGVRFPPKPDPPV